MKRSGLKRRRTKLARRTPMSPGHEALTRHKRLKRAPFSPASPEQRAKVKGERCVHCERRATDPMHLCPRSQGGCDDPLCVVPGCRSCHRAFDRGDLDLLADLVRRFKAEIAHAQLHMTPIRLLERLTGCEVVLRKRSP